MTKSVVILFGSCLASAKESYQIHFPQTAVEAQPSYVNETSALQKVLLQIITSDQMKATNKALPITNTFLLFNRNKPATTDNLELSLLRNFKLNRTCKKITFNLRDASEFEIYQETNEQQQQHGARTDEPESDNWYQSKVFVKGFNDILVNNKSIWN
jgi:hypothetical protein